ncbi:hypothetical protein LSTR_LSTR010251 [Laodelphax striatellus]|uniref:Uncharacterized protein n=1 Tax=Laodelphax striatellus TaxID=195883 RepID=A0A482WL50_LAOST|nr:hypothetical protein LSTR_LSTR010251 [Laodelphax striatellus]
MEKSPSVDDLLRLYKDYLTKYSSIVEQKESFTIISAQQMKNLKNECRYILQSLPKYLPQVDSDGYRNLWLVKDSDLSCGKGVWVVEKLSDALEQGKIADREKESRKSSMRFSSQPFNLDDTHEAIQGTKPSVQRKYEVHPERHAALPQNNMWDSTTFRKYLKSLGHEDKWTKVIYPSMKASIVAALQVSQEGLVDRPNSFELYGADFILTEDFSPWLIEINSSPAMHSSTSVTRSLCTQCFKDVIKVVIDYNKSQQANTGDFELIYNQRYFYQQVNPQWHFPDIHTYGTPLKMTKNQIQTEPLSIMDALKKKKWKTYVLESTQLSTVSRMSLRPQQKTIIEAQKTSLVNVLTIRDKTTSKTLIKRDNRSRSNSNDKSKNKVPDENMKKTFLTDENMKKTFLRSTQKIKYISLPKITAVDRTYFQVIERNRIENIKERPFEPELNLSLFNNRNLVDLVEELETVEESGKDSSSIVDFNPQEIKSKGVDIKYNLFPKYDIEREPNILEVYHLNAQNQSNFLSNELNLEYGSEIDDEHHPRFRGMSNDFDSSEDIYKDFDIGEDIHSSTKSKMDHNLQVNPLDEGFNNIIENYSNSNEDKYFLELEEEYKNILEQFFGNNRFENSLSDCLLENRLLHEMPYDTEQEITNEIDRKCLLNIYLTMKKENVDLYETNNDRPSVEIESANNVSNYIFFIQPSSRPHYGIDNDDTIILEDDSITRIQEPEGKIVIDKRQVQESIGDAERNHLMKDDVLTTLNQQIHQPQGCITIQRHSNTNLNNNETNELGNQSIGEKIPEKKLKEKLHTIKESNQIFPSSRSILQNNQSQIFSVYILICTLIVAFLGYIVLFHDLSSFDMIFNKNYWFIGIGKLGTGVPRNSGNTWMNNINTWIRGVLPHKY